MGELIVDGFCQQQIASPLNTVNRPLQISIVDDDPAVLDALQVIFEIEGYVVSTFVDGSEFLAAKDQEPDCVLLDVNMPVCSGSTVLQVVKERACSAPIIMMSGRGDIPMAVAALKAGACDFIEKPFGDHVVERVREAVRASRAPHASDSPPLADPAFPGMDMLTRREREVLAQLTKGRSNKEVARELKISPRTVEVHRARIMEKIGARNTADLMRIVFG
jgi:FixJ family two-component response regulator